jgi:hypothetical protein
MRIIASGALFALLTAGVPVFAQDAAKTAAPRYVSVVGAVEKVDTAAKSLALKPDKGDTTTTIKFDDKTQFLRLPAGELDTKKATRATAADVGVGDRAIARIRPEDPAGAPAVFLYFSKQSDLAQRQQKTLQDWQTQSVAGSVKTVDAGTKQIVMSVRGIAGPPRDVTLDLTGAVDYQRFSPDSGKYEASALAPIQTGDQVRVLGQKNADQSAIKVEAIMSGYFKTVPVQIKSIDPATNQIMATDLGSKRPITISIKPDTTMKKLDDATALLMARRLNPSFQAAGGRGGRGGEGRGAEAAPAPDGAAPNAGALFGAGGRGGPGGPGGGGPGFGGRGGGGARNQDPSRLLEQQPTIALGDLKAGDPVVVTGAPSSDMTKITAMTLVAGVEQILRAAPQNGPDPLGGNWNFGDIGGAPQ